VRLLLDQNLSLRLVRALADVFPDPLKGAPWDPHGFSLTAFLLLS
jgi:hypothetical protein